MTETVAPQATNTDPQKEAGREKTSYAVLEKIKARLLDDEEEVVEVFRFVKYVDAMSSLAAIKSLGAEGTFVAPPARSFVEKTGEAETQTKLTFK